MKNGQGNAPILEITDPKDLHRLRSGDFSEQITLEEFDHVFRLADALWLHDGDLAMPHAELTSERCSDGFVDVLRVLKYTNLCEIFARELISIYNFGRVNFGLTGKAPKELLLDPDWVIGSDHAGATISYEVARQLKAKHDFTEKGPDKTQLWRRHVIEPDEVVLQVEELITTTGTLQDVREGIRNGNPNPVTFVPVVMTLVHRSDTYEFEESPILYFRHYDIASWKPEECPLCAVGSKRLRPKQNWAELTRKE